MTTDISTALVPNGKVGNLVHEVPTYDYTVNGYSVEGQDRAYLILGRALESVDPAAVIESSHNPAIIVDPRHPSQEPVTLGEFVATLESEFGLSPADWPPTASPYTSSRGGKIDINGINALIQSLGDQLAGDASTIPFEFVRPDSYIVLGDETSGDLANQFGVNPSLLTSEQVATGRVVNLADAALTVAPLTSNKRTERVASLISELKSKIAVLSQRIEHQGIAGYSADYTTDIWSTSEHARQSFSDYLNNYLNPALEELTGKTLEESVLPYGAGSLYGADRHFTQTSIVNLSAAIGRFETAELQGEGVPRGATAPAQTELGVTPVVGNITRGTNGAFYVDGAQRPVLRIIADLRLSNIDEEATRSAELLQTLNARIEKSALGSDLLDLIDSLSRDDDGNFAAQASLWARGDLTGDTPTAFADGLRALAEQYNVDDPFVAFLPNHELDDTRIITHEDLVALQHAIGAFQDTATRDNERDNLAIQESHTKLNVLLENLNAIIGLISKIAEIARNIG